MGPLTTQKVRRLGRTSRRTPPSLVSSQTTGITSVGLGVGAVGVVVGWVCGHKITTTITTAMRATPTRISRRLKFTELSPVTDRQECLVGCYSFVL